MILDAEGLFNGDRWNRCSDHARLNAPYFLLTSNGFARLEISYRKIVGRAYSGFRTPPTEEELMRWIGEYASAHLLFLYESDGQVWGAWDTRLELLPRYKTAADRRSPEPPEPGFTEWKRAYRSVTKRFPKFLENLPKSSRKLSATFPHGIGVVGVIGEGKTPLTPLSEIPSEPGTVGVRISEVDESDDGLRWYTREEAGCLIREGAAHLQWELPEDFADLPLIELGWKLELLNKAIIGFGVSPWSDEYSQDAERLQFGERNGLNMTDYELIGVAA
jgi:hypothetical protein